MPNQTETLARLNKEKEYEDKLLENVRAAELGQKEQLLHEIGLTKIGKQQASQIFDEKAGSRFIQEADSIRQSRQ